MAQSLITKSDNSLTFLSDDSSRSIPERLTHESSPLHFKHLAVTMAARVAHVAVCRMPHLLTFAGFFALLPASVQTLAIYVSTLCAICF